MARVTHRAPLGSAASVPSCLARRIRADGQRNERGVAGTILAVTGSRRRASGKLSRTRVAQSDASRQTNQRAESDQAGEVTGKEEDPRRGKEREGLNSELRGIRQL